MEYNIALLPETLLIHICAHPILAEKFANIEKSRFVSMMQCVMGMMMQQDYNASGSFLGTDLGCVLKRAHSHIAITGEEASAWTECLEAAMRELSLDDLIQRTLANVRQTLEFMRQAQERRASIDRMSEMHGRGEDITFELRTFRDEVD